MKAVAGNPLSLSMPRLLALVGPTLVAVSLSGGGDSWGTPANADPTLDASVPGSTQASRHYYLYVCAESDDVVEKIRFGPSGFQHLKSIPVGAFPTEIEGPHGIGVSPDGAHWYLSMAHGLPFGTLYKFDTENDEYINDVTLGMYPATLSFSAGTGLLFVVNFNLHGDPEPSTISVVETESMTEVGSIPTGVMPHGSRMNREGTRHYSVNMMNDDLVEVDTYRMEVSRRLPLSEHAPQQIGGMRAGGSGRDAEMSTPKAADLLKPTWATPPTPQGKLYVAGNGKRVILEVDIEAWQVSRRFENTGAGPYNLDVTPDGTTLAATYKGDAAVGFWDLGEGEEIARIGTLRPVPHGVIITPDGRYAFVSIEGIGGEPGSVEAYDLQSFERVDNIDLGKQTGGIALWKIE